jgi:hypothetical protein
MLWYLFDNKLGGTMNAPDTTENARPRIFAGNNSADRANMTGTEPPIPTVAKQGFVSTIKQLQKH